MNSKVIGAIIAVVVVIAIIFGLTNRDSGNDGDQASNQTITGAGATFAAPLYGQLGSEYKNETGTTINYQSVGSGAGVAQFLANTVNYGATDVALKDEEVSQAEEKGTPFNIPVAFGAVTVSYNVPGVEAGLQLDGETIANIYLGKVTKWNDPAIAGLNPDVDLPDLRISPVYRSDESGTTAQFTEFLADVSAEWSEKLGTDKTVKWPIGTGSKGNEGVAATTSQTEGAIGYVELAYALQNNFTTAAVKNTVGEFVTPSLESTSKAGDNLPDLPEDLRFSAINSPNTGAYPIASATFILVYQDPCEAGAVSDADQAKALNGWLDYIFGAGQESMQQLEYAKLPDSLLQKAQEKVDSMTCNGNSL
jgi:phosphate transport system substrate-binding protein